MIYLGRDPVSISGLEKLDLGAIEKIDSGIYIPSVNMVIAPVVQHNLGVIPDLFFFYVPNITEEDLTDSNMTLSGIYIRGVQHQTTNTTYKDSLYCSSNGVKGGLGYPQSAFTNITTELNKVQPTDKQCTFLKNNNNYIFKGGYEYRWVAIKFKEGATV